MEQETKTGGVEHILDDLYAIRTGMSIISQKKDEIDKKYEEANEQLTEFDQTILQNLIPLNQVSNHTQIEFLPIESIKEIATPKTTTDENSEQNDSEKVNNVKLFEKRRAFYQTEAVDKMEVATATCKHRYEKYKSLSSTLKIFFAISILLSITFLALTFTVNGFLFFVAAVFIALTIFIGYQCSNQVNRMRFYKRIHRNSSETLQALKQSNDLIAKFAISIESFSKPLMQSSKALYDEMTAQYHSLDLRDWKYTDTLIYYFETGRADSVKEALQHLDRLIQTNEIIGTIKQSAKYICGSIERMSNSICARLDVMSRQLSTIGHAQAVQISQTSALLTQQSMQNALIAKMGTSSEQLASDVRSLTSGIDYIKLYK